MPLFSLFEKKPISQEDVLFVAHKHSVELGTAFRHYFHARKKLFNEMELALVFDNTGHEESVREQMDAVYQQVQRMLEEATQMHLLLHANKKAGLHEHSRLLIHVLATGRQQVQDLLSLKKTADYKLEKLRSILNKLLIAERTHVDRVLAPRD